MNTRVGKGLGRFDLVLVCFLEFGKAECRETVATPTPAGVLVFLVGVRVLA
jgi:hypothetical protein